MSQSKTNNFTVPSAPGQTAEHDAQESLAGDPLLVQSCVTQFPDVAADWAAQQRIAADPTRVLDERLEAFEDILDSEIGDTNLSRARNIEREVGLRQIYLKFEGGNPTGTQKDRIAFAQAMDAMRRGFDTVTVATCGNYGVAMALACSFAGLRCLIYVPHNYKAKRLSELADSAIHIHRVEGDYEAAVDVSRQRAAADELYDANPGGANTALQLRAYGQIAFEIYDELRDAPAMVAVPVSNGTTLAGIYKGFVSLYRRGKTSRLPRMVAGSAYHKNPIVLAFLKNEADCRNLDRNRIKESAINEPLINWHSIDGDAALDAIRHSRGFAGHASDKGMGDYSRFLLDKEGLSVLPASTAGLIALLDEHRKVALPSDRYVVVLTGKKP